MGEQPDSLEHDARRVDQYPVVSDGEQQGQCLRSGQRTQYAPAQVDNL